MSPRSPAFARNRDSPPAAQRHAFVSYKEGSGPGGARELFFAVKLSLNQAGFEVVQGAELSSQARHTFSHVSLPGCTLALVLLSQDYLHCEDCCAEAKEVAASNIPLLSLHDAKYIEAKQALDMGPLAFDLGLDALFRAPVRGLHSRDIDGFCGQLMEEIAQLLNPSPTHSHSTGQQRFALVSYKPGRGKGGGRDAFVVAKQMLKTHGYKVVQCIEEDPNKRMPSLHTALAQCALAVLVVSEAYFDDEACRREAGEILDAGVGYFPVHDCKYLSAMEALNLAPRAAKYDLDAVFDRQIVPLHSQEPKLFAQQWNDALHRQT